MTARFANNFESKLTEAVTAEATVIKISADDAARLPSLANGDWCPLSLSDPRGYEEIVHVTAINNGQLTVKRAQESTTAKAFRLGARVDLRLTAAAIDSFLGLYFGARPLPPANVPIGSLYLNTASTPNTMMALGATGWAPAVTISVAGTRRQIYVATEGATGPFTVDGGFSNGAVNVNGVTIYPGYGLTLNIAAGKFTLDTPLRAGSIVVFDGYLANNAVDIYTKAEVNRMLAEMEARTRVPVGTEAWIDASVAPSGWLAQNGNLYNIATYPDLAEFYGTKYGGDGVNTFGVPDRRGYVPRAWDNGRGVDPGRTLGSYQGDAIRQITGGFSSFVPTNHQNYVVGAFGSASGTVNSTTTSPAEYHAPSGTQQDAMRYGYDFVASRVVPTAAENRMKNFSALFIVKY